MTFRIARYGLAAYVAVLACAPAIAEESRRYRFHVYSETDGLADLNVSVFLQNHTGFLWVGTNNGLYRFDGFRFRRFGIEAGLPTETITSLVEDGDGRLWVATQAGVSFQTGNRFEKVDLHGASPTVGPQTLARDPFGNGIYVATTGGLLSVSGRKANLVPNTSGLPVWSTFSQGSKGLWYALSARICFWNGRESQCRGREAGLPNDRWGGLAVDFAGTLWARNTNSLLALRSGAAGFEDRSAGLPATYKDGVLCLDAKQRLIIPTDTGIALWSDRGWSMITRDDGLVVPSSTWAMEDREGALWIGMQGGGIARSAETVDWENWTTENGLEDDQVWAVGRDSAGTVFIGSNSGLSTLKGGSIHKVQEANVGFGSNRVRALAIDSGDAVWMGTARAGLLRLGPGAKSITRFGNPSDPDGNIMLSVMAIALGKDRSVWIAATNGVFHGMPDGKRMAWHKQSIPRAVPNEAFYGIVEDRAGRVWASGNQGLAVWNGQAWSRVPGPDGQPIQIVSRLAEAPDGSIWVAYRGSGNLGRISARGKIWVTEKIASVGARPTPDISSFIGFDRAGNLWRGTGSGAYVLSHSRWGHYARTDGLAWDYTSINAFFSDPDGSVWIGTSHGLSHHLFSKADSATPPAPPIITEVTAGEKSFGPDIAQPIDYRIAPITFSYSSLGFGRQADLRFRYRMMGWDQVWTEGIGRTARYAELKPGHYTFEVSVGTWNGLWSEQIARVPITISGPWWTSSLFWFVLAALLAGVIAVVWRMRENAHRRRESALAAAVRDRTLELDQERLRETERNRILEMLVANESLRTVLDATIALIRPGAAELSCAILLNHPGGCQVAAARGFSPEWLTLLEAPHAIPVDIWRKSLASLDVSEDPYWKSFALIAGEGIPVAVYSWPIGRPGTDMGALLVRCPAGVELADKDRDVAEVCSRMGLVAIEHSRLYDDLHFQAYHDSLTGLPNRILLEERLERSLREASILGQQLAVIFIDLDRFKQINDRFSHRVGDLYLCELASRMKKAVRSNDLVARVGGDEFTVLLTNVGNTEETGDLAAAILHAIRQPLVIDGHELFPAASAGLAVFPADGKDAEQLRRAADAAMYCAKNSGRDRLQTFASRNEVLDRVRMEEELRAALEESYFAVHYQPKVDASGKLAGFEALVRMNHPKHGMIQPADFIHIAESSGLIVPLGAWVLEEVCRQVSEWRMRGFGRIPVAVNASPVQIGRPDFAESVNACLSHHGVSPADLEIELTETFLVSGNQEAQEQMRKLRAAGVRLSIDDFGTGYSSLSYLYKLQVDAIKLDKSFVQSIDSDPLARRLVQAMITVAQSLGLDVIAEGVETKSQRAMLLAAGCQLMQGYLFARPQSASELDFMLRGNSPFADEFVSDTPRRPHRKIVERLDDISKLAEAIKSV